MGLPRPACRGWRLGRRVVTAGALAVLALAVASAAVPIEDPTHGESTHGVSAALHNLAGLPRRLLTGAAKLGAPLLCASAAIACTNTIAYKGTFVSKALTVSEAGPVAAAVSSAVAATPQPVVAPGLGYGELYEYNEYYFGPATAGGLGGGAAVGPETFEAPFGGPTNLPGAGGLAPGVGPVVAPETTTEGVFGGTTPAQGIGGAATPAG